MVENEYGTFWNFKVLSHYWNLVLYNLVKLSDYNQLGMWPTISNRHPPNTGLNTQRFICLWYQEIQGWTVWSWSLVMFSSPVHLYCGGLITLTDMWSLSGSHCSSPCNKNRKQCCVACTKLGGVLLAITELLSLNTNHSNYVTWPPTAAGEYKEVSILIWACCHC